jgi:hypothetical protein
VGETITIDENLTTNRWWEKLIANNKEKLAANKK